jgi:hypothetical protein
MIEEEGIDVENICNVGSPIGLRIMLGRGKESGYHERYFEGNVYLPLGDGGSLDKLMEF